MKKMAIWTLKLLLIAALFYWIVKDIDPDLLLKSLKHLNPWGIFLTLVAVFVSDLVISWRWYYLSRFQYSFLSSLEANMLAFFLNIFAPAKLGDLSKIYYMKKKEGHQITHSTSYFLVERLFDVLILAAMLLFCAIFILPSQATLWVALGLFGFFLLAGYLLHSPKAFRRLLSWLPFPKVRALLYKIYKILRSNLTPKRLGALFLLTLAVWGSYYLNNFIFFLTTTDLELELWQIFVASTLAFALSAIPLTPGGIGTFQAAFILALGWYGIPKEEALSASLVLQFLYILPATLYSLYLFATKDFLWRGHVSA